MEIQRPLGGLSLTLNSTGSFREGPVGRTCPSDPSKMVVLQIFSPEEVQPV